MLQEYDPSSFRKYGKYIYCDLNFDAMKAHKYQVRIKKEKPYTKYNRAKEMARRVRQMNG